MNAWQEIRWKQRFSNYEKALVRLEDGVRQIRDGAPTELEMEGLVQRFEYTYELAWKTLQDLLRDRGYLDIAGPGPVLEQAAQDGLILDVEGWKRLKKSRELTSHTYDQGLAEAVNLDIQISFLPLFQTLHATLKEMQR